MGGEEPPKAEGGSSSGGRGSKSGGKEDLGYTIRYATEKDVPEILAMIHELADYEHALHEVHASESSLLKTLSFPSSPDTSSTTPSFTPGYARTLLIFPSSHSLSPQTQTHPPTTTTTTTTTAPPAAAAGLALFFNNYSTWHSAPGIYLEDLFVRPAHRGRGFGKALLQRLARECVEIGGARLEWSVLKWNEPSIRFYEGASVGAKMMSEWVGMRVEGEEALGKLARGGVEENGGIERVVKGGEGGGEGGGN